MQVLAIGVVRMSGIGKESGKPYDFAQLIYLKPVEPVEKEKFQLRAYGYEPTKADVDNGSFEKFSQVVFPCRLELELDTIPGREGFRTVITGFKVAQVKQAA